MSIGMRKEKRIEVTWNMGLLASEWLEYCIIKWVQWYHKGKNIQFVAVIVIIIIISSNIISNIIQSIIEFIICYCHRHCLLLMQYYSLLYY